MGTTGVDRQAQRPVGMPVGGASRRGLAANAGNSCHSRSGNAVAKAGVWNGCRQGGRYLALARGVGRRCRGFVEGKWRACLSRGTERAKQASKQARLDRGDLQPRLAPLRGALQPPSRPPRGGLFPSRGWNLLGSPLTGDRRCPPD